MSGSVVNSCHRPLMSYNIEILYLAFRRRRQYSAVVVKSSVTLAAAFTVSHSLSLSAFQQSLAVTLKLLCQSFSCHFSTVTTENSCCRSVKLVTCDVTRPCVPAQALFQQSTACFCRHFSQIPVAEKDNNHSKAGSPYEWIQLGVQRFTQVSPIWSNSQPLDELRQTVNQYLREAVGVGGVLHTPPLHNSVQNSKYRAYGTQETGLQGNRSDQ